MFRSLILALAAAHKIVFVWLAPAPMPPVLSRHPLSDSINACATRTLALQGDSLWAALEDSRPDGSPFSTFAFIDDSGQLLARGDSMQPSAGYVFAVLNQALDKQARLEDARALEEVRRSGNNDPSVLEGIISEKSAEGLPADSLLQVYVDQLSRDSLTSVRVVRFLALQAPVLNSEANQWLRQDPGVFRGVWNSLSAAQQVQVNSAVIRKTCARAARDRDVEEAKLAAVFAANTHAGPEARVRAFQGVMMDYYFEAADTFQFEDAALAYYNHFLMPLKADSLRARDSLMQQGVSGYVAMELRKGSRRFYRLGVTDSLLRQAITWATRANYLEETPEGLDLEARLVARSGNKAFAADLQRRSQVLAKEKNEYLPTR